MPSPIRLAISVLALAAAAGCRGSRSAPSAAPAPVTPAEPADLTDTTGLVRVQFSRGTTSGLVNDSLGSGESRGYLIGADQGQVMMIHAITWRSEERRV